MVVFSMAALLTVTFPTQTELTGLRKSTETRNVIGNTGLPFAGEASRCGGSGNMSSNRHALTLQDDELGVQSSVREPGWSTTEGRNDNAGEP